MTTMLSAGLQAEIDVAIADAADGGAMSLDNGSPSYSTDVGLLLFLALSLSLPYLWLNFRAAAYGLLGTVAVFALVSPMLRRGCLFSIVPWLGLLYLWLRFRVVAVYGLLGTFAVLALVRVWQWNELRRARATHRAGYPARKAALETRWRETVAVIESHAGTLVAERLGALTTDKWGREVGLDDWREVRREFADEVLPTLVDCSWMNNAITCVIPKVVEEVACARLLEAPATPVENMSGSDFERHCASILKSAGWQTRLTKGSGDQGVDIVATKDGWSVAIQCKRYESSVGNKAVQEVHAGMKHYGCDAGAVVASCPFTNGAKALAASTKVRLFMYNQLHNLEPW